MLDIFICLLIFNRERGREIWCIYIYWIEGERDSLIFDRERDTHIVKLNK